MNSDKGGAVRFDFAFDQSDELFVAGRAAKSDDAKMTKFSGEICFGFFFHCEFGCCSVRFKILFHFPPILCAFKTDVAPMCKERESNKKGAWAMYKISTHRSRAASFFVPARATKMIQRLFNFFRFKFIFFKNECPKPPMAII